MIAKKLKNYINSEKKRQNNTIELIASENFGLQNQVVIACPFHPRKQSRDSFDYTMYRINFVALADVV